jgi:hypothetical protein
LNVTWDGAVVGYDIEHGDIVSPPGKEMAQDAGVAADIENGKGELCRLRANSLLGYFGVEGHRQVLGDTHAPVLVERQGKKFTLTRGQAGLVRGLRAEG